MKEHMKEDEPPPQRNTTNLVKRLVKRKAVCDVEATINLALYTLFNHHLEL